MELTNISDIHESDHHEHQHDVPEWVHILEIVYLTLITLFGGLGNASIIFVQSKNLVKVSTDYLIITLAAVDLYGASFNTLLYLCRHVSAVWHVIASDLVCCVHIFSVYMTSISSTVLLTATAIDRYLQTCKPTNSVYNKNKAKRVCIFAIVCSMIMSIPALCTYELDNDMYCSRTGHNASIMYILDCVYACVFTVMFTIVSVSYVKVALALRRRHRIKVEAKPSANACNDTEQRSANTNTTIQHKVAKLSIIYSNKIAPEQSCVYKTENSPTPNNLSTTYPSSSRNDAALGTKVVSRNSGVIHESQIVSSSNQLSDTESVVLFTQYVDKTKQQLTSRNLQEEHLSVKDNAPEDKDSDKGSNQTTINQSVQRSLRLEETRINKTSTIMFLITLVYIISWLVNWVVMLFFNSETLHGRIIKHMIKSSFMINSVTNYVFYISMSSKFRDTATSIMFQRMNPGRNHRN